MRPLETNIETIETNNETHDETTETNNETNNVFLILRIRLTPIYNCDKTNLDRRVWPLHDKRTTKY